MAANRTGIALVLVAATMFGTIGTLSRLFYDHGGHPYTVLFVRSVVGAAAFSLIALARREPRPSRAAAWHGLVLGGVQFGGIAALQEGYARAPVALVVLLFYVYPLLVTVGAAVFLHEGFGLPRAAALAGGLTGIVLIVGVPESVSGAGIVLGLLAGACIATTILVGRHLMTEHAVSPTWLNALLTTGPAVALLIAMPARVPDLGVDATAWALLAGIVLGSSVLAVNLFYTGIKLVGASTAALLGNVEPLVSVLMAYAILGESLSAVQVAGGLLIVLSVALLSVHSFSADRLARTGARLPHSG